MTKKFTKRLRKKNRPRSRTNIHGNANSRWELIISVVALLVAIGSFVFSIQTERAKSAPNVQVQSVNGGRERISGDTQDSIIIRSEIVLANVGNAPTQIVDVDWDFVSSSDERTKLNGWLAISDTWDPSKEQDMEFFRSIKDTPIEGIKQTTLEAGGSVTLKLAFFSDPLPKYDTTLQNIRVIFTFSSGQQITVLPELKYFAVEAGW